MIRDHVAEVHRLQRTTQKRDRVELPLARGQGRQPRGVTLRPKSQAAAESARLQQHRSGREELPRVRGQEQ